MRINEYYRDTAHLNLNGSIAALIPTIMIVAANLSMIKQREVMLCVIPFLIYSFIHFQIYLFRMRQSIAISRNLDISECMNLSLFAAQHLLVLFKNTQSSSVHFYLPNGHLSGRIEKVHVKGWKRFRFLKIYALYNFDREVLGFFKVKGRKSIRIEVYNRNSRFLGSFEKKNIGWRKSQRLLFDDHGKYIGTIEGSSIFMDEQVMDTLHQQVGRLRRGWMPLDWSSLFPEPNTPVLSFKGIHSDEDKLLRMSFLINEYFIER